MKLKHFLKVLRLTTIFLAAFVLVLAIPVAQQAWVRHKLEQRAFVVKGTKEGGGGTGFQVEAPSGISYIITNSHICEHAQKDGNDKNFLIVRKNGFWMKRRILEVSENSDLCLVEGWPDLSGLKLGGKVIPGDSVSAVGHPLLGPTTMVSGEVVEYTDTLIQHHIMLSGNKQLDKFLGASGEACDQPKNEIVKQPFMVYGLLPLGEVPLCMMRERKAIQTNLLIFSGNSGSPLVDKKGDVVGVVFASNSVTNWGFAVNLEHLKTLLENY